MAQYTTEVRSICEHYADLQESAGYNSIDSIIEKSAPKIFSFDFPLFDENYRLALEKKILRHYYTREIGDETVGLWKLRLETRLNEIMPYYNQLYKSTLYEFNPFYDVDTVRSHQTKNDGTTTTNSNQDYAGNIKGSGSTTDTVETNGTASSNSTSDNTSKSSGSNTSETTSSGTGDTKNRYSDTPQGSLQNIENNTYLTNATIVDSTTSTKENSSGSSSSGGTSNTTNKGNSENHSTRTVNGTSENNQDSTNNTKYQSTGTAKSMEEYVEHVTGKVGTTSYSDMLLKFRKTFLNIDMMIINDLQPLFFELW
jgi:hypothetical protein